MTRIMLHLLISSSIWASLQGVVQAESGTWQAELGYEAAWSKSRQDVTLSRPYVDMGWTHSFDLRLVPDEVRVAAHFRRAVVQQGVDTPKNQAFLEELSGRWDGDTWSLILGLQEIAWGETFGLVVTDVVNPRDLRESPFAALAEARLPSWSLNHQLYFGSANLQIIATPLPTTTPLPNELNGVPVERSQSLEAFEDGEYGGRFGYLFESGLDVKIFVMRHMSRIPAYEMVLSPTGPEISYLTAPVLSYGLSYSYVWDSLVMRGDGIHTENQLVGGLAQKKTGVSQGIFGLDYTFNSGTVLGGQYHIERWEDERPNIDGDQTSHWLSAQVRRVFFDHRLETRFFVFRGLDNADFWVKPEVTWHVGELLSASLSYDMVDGELGKEGFFGPFQDEDRYTGKVSVRF